MTDEQALQYAQHLWGSGTYNAKIKRVSGKKFQVGRYNPKRSWIIGEGSTWEAAFLAAWKRILEQRQYTPAPTPSAELAERMNTQRVAVENGNLPEFDPTGNYLTK